MKLSTLQENLNQGLFAVSHVTGKNINLPILSNILIEARDGNIKLIATDLEIGVVSVIRGKVEKGGSITVDAKIFSEFISLLPNKKIDIELKNNDLVVVCDNYKTTIKGQASEDYPLIPQIERKEHKSIKTETLKKALSQVVFAVSGSESRMELSGVFFNFNKNKLVLAATDSYRLAEREVEINSNGNTENQVIIPAKTIQEILRIVSGIKKIITDEGEEIKFYFSENQILFSFGSTELVSRLIEGQYPDYKQIIPANHKTTVTINKDEFSRAVKAASIFSKTGINDINLDLPINKNKLIISSTSGQTGENITELDATVSGAENSIVLNYRYLLDGVNNLDGENIKIEIIDGNTPCVLRNSSSTEASDNKKEEKDYLYIIMPIKQ